MAPRSRWRPFFASRTARKSHVRTAAPEALEGGGAKPATYVRAGTPDRSDRSSPIPHGSQLGSPDGSLARPAAHGACRAISPGSMSCCRGPEVTAVRERTAARDSRASQTYSNTIQPRERTPRWPGL